MNRINFVLVAIACTLTCGCDFTQKPTPVAVAAPPSTADLPLVAHPEFANWNQFPVGTKVIRKDRLASSEGETLLHTVLQLENKSEKGLTITTQTAIERDGKREESDPTSVDYPATFPLPKGMAAELFTLPDPLAKRMGAETIQVDGKTYEAEVYTFKDKSEAGPVDVKLWRSSEIPGRQAKKEIVDQKGLVLSSSETVSIQLGSN